MSFMLAYWLSLAAILFYFFVIWVNDEYTWGLYGRHRRYVIRLNIILGSILILGFFGGLWIPVFVPGVY